LRLAKLHHVHVLIGEWDNDCLTRGCVQLVATLIENGTRDDNFLPLGDILPLVDLTI
jgi:hypothetical protein